MEQIEESWQTETKELIGKVGRLQEENKKLRSALNDTKEQVDSLQCKEKNLFCCSIFLFFIRIFEVFEVIAVSLIIVRI